MTIGRKMDAAWKEAISRALKASGKIQHTASQAVKSAKSTSNKIGLTNAGTRIGIKRAMQVGGAVGGALGAASGIKQVGTAIIKKPKLLTKKSSLGGAVKLVRANAMLGSGSGKLRAGFSGLKLADKAGVRNTITGKLRFK